MGKLSKIRRAFNNSSESTKKSIWFHGYGCSFLEDGSVSFSLRYPTRYSYKRYVAKIAEEWMVNVYGHEGEVALCD